MIEKEEIRRVEQNKMICFSFQFSAIAATSDGRILLIDVQDSFTPVFTEYLLNESFPGKVKYEIIVVLHNLSVSILIFE